LVDTDPNPYQPPNSPAAGDGLSGDTFVLSGCLTVQDALAAHRLATRGFWPRIVLAISIISVFSIVLIAIAVSSWPYSPGAAHIMLLVACVIFPALVIVPFLIGRFRLRRFARNKLGMFAPTRSTFSPAGIIATSANAKTELEWPLFSHCVSNDTVALLYYQNSKQHLILARSKLESSGDWESFVSMIQCVLAAPSGT
jgi:ABC-type multidrug transport system fused ATPase/permease subunit